MNILPQKHKEKLAKIFTIRGLNIFLAFNTFVLLVFAVISFVWYVFLNKELKRVANLRVSEGKVLRQNKSGEIEKLAYEFLKIKNSYPHASAALKDLQSVFDTFSRDIFVVSINLSANNQEALSVTVKAKTTNKESLLALVKTLKNQDFVRNLDIQKTLLSLTRSKDAWGFVLKFDYAKN